MAANKKPPATHSQKAHPVTAWRHVEGAALPQWARDGAISDSDLRREIDDGKGGTTVVHPVPVGSWLVRRELPDGSVSIAVMANAAFEHDYE